MRLIETYSLTAGQQINHPELITKYYPLPFTKYCTFQGISKDSKNYDRFDDVISIIRPILEKYGIKIVQIGAKGEKSFNGCYQTQGNTSLSQANYIIKNSLCHFGVDSVWQHVAGIFNIPLVDLTSNNYAHNVAPYFGDKNKQIILEPSRAENEKPSFSLQENPKTINKIKPELVAYSILKLLGLENEYNFNFESIFLGVNYQNKLIELIPNQIMNVSNLGINNLIVRMDYVFNESVLNSQLDLINCSIVTNKPINLELLKAKKTKITQFIYELNRENNNPEYIKELSKIGINFIVFSFESPEWVNSQKLNYFDYCVILNKGRSKKEEIAEIKDIPSNKLYFKSNKFSVDSGLIYPSKQHWLEKKQLTNSLECPIIECIDKDEFWNENEYHYYLKYDKK